VLELLAQAAVPGDIASLGVIAVALLTGAGIAYKWVGLPERIRAGAAEDEVKRLNAIVIDRVVPALVSATDIQAKTQGLLVQLQRRSGNEDL
jgi:hypothetical protein